MACLIVGNKHKGFYIYRNVPTPFCGPAAKLTKWITGEDDSDWLRWVVELICHLVALSHYYYYFFLI